MCLSIYYVYVKSAMFSKAVALPSKADEISPYEGKSHTPISF